MGDYEGGEDPRGALWVSGQGLLVQWLNKDHKNNKVVLGTPPASPILQVTSLLFRFAGHCWPGSQGYCMWEGGVWGARGWELYNQREPAEGEGCAWHSLQCCSPGLGWS